MAEWSDFSTEFIKRTKCNLAMYEGEFEVTNLINCCLGLIVIPKQLLAERIPDRIVYEEDLSYGINRNRNNIQVNDGTSTEDKKYSLQNIIRHIRNGLSHGRIVEQTENGSITGLRIYDKQKETSESENFSIEFKLAEFKTFALRVSDEFLKVDRE